MIHFTRLFAIVAAVFVIAQPVAGAAEREPRPEIFRRLVDCRAIADGVQRLACYDAQVAAIDQAERDRQVVVVDRAQVKEARRSLFGLTLPSLSLFGGGDHDKADAEEFSAIETTIKSAHEDANGRWIITLADGARWVQADSRELPIAARAGQKIKIRQAAMGSFLANINGQIAIRMKREN